MKVISKIALVILIISPFILNGCSGDSINEYKKDRIIVDNSPTPDNTPPSLLSAEAVENNVIAVKFNEPVEKTSAETANNYHIQGNNRVNVVAALLDSDNITVNLTVSTGYDYGMQHGKEYTLLVQRVADISSNNILNEFTNFLGKGSVLADVYRGSAKMPLSSPYPMYNSKDLEFTISGTNVGSYQFSCDNATWSNEVNVSVPVNLYNLSEGPHTLKVVGRNSLTGEWQDVNFASVTGFMIDTVAPVTTLDHLPANVSDKRDIEVIVSSSDATGYRYRLNNDDWSDLVLMSDRIVYQDLRDRGYTLQVQGVDDAGNIEAAINSYSWTISGSLPAAVINNAPPRYTKMRNISIAIDGNNIKYYKYTFNGITSEILSTDEIISRTNLSDGTYTLEITGYSSLDETSAGPVVTQVWTIDNIAPECSLSNLPLTPTNSQQTYIVVGSAAGDVTKYSYRVNDGAMSGIYEVSAPLELSALPQGNYKLEVFGIDAAGNQQTAAAVWNWSVDLTSPRVVLENLPLKEDVSNDASIQVVAGDVKAYKYILDSNNLTSEISVAQDGTIAFIDLADGYHTISVVGRDEAGNWQSLRDATEYTWLVDTKAPAAVLTDYPAAVSNKTAYITFSVAGTGVVKYRYSLDSDNNYGFEYDRYTQSITIGDVTPLGTGPHTLYVIGCDSTGNWQSKSAADVTKYTWIIDTEVAEAMLLNAPAGETKSSTINITVTGVDKYKYKLDQLDWVGGAVGVDVSVPISASGLVEGGHTLTVIGFNGVQWQDLASPTTLSWSVDTTPPLAEFKSVPDERTSSSTSNFEIAGNGVYAYRYVLDDGGVSFGPQVLISEYPVINTGALGNGPHTIYVKGIDQAGNEQTGITSYTWTVDATTPYAVLSGLPAALTKETSIDVGVTCANILTYKYKLDNADWSIEYGSSNRITRLGLGAGDHTLLVLAKNSAGTWQLDPPTTHPWNIDATPPSADDIILDNLPANPSSVTANIITVSGSIVAYQYKLDDNNWSSERSTLTGPTENQISLSGLGPVSHTLLVIGKDAAGNWTDRTMAKSHTWVVDTANPIAVISNTPYTPTNQKGIDLVITGTDLTGYKYSIDGEEPWIDGTLPNNIVRINMSEGPHTLLVKGVHNGYEQAVATPFDWIIDTAAPVAVLSNKPVTGTKDRSINIDVSGTDVVAYQYYIDSLPWLPASSEKGVDSNIIASELSVGTHTVYVRARDTTRSDALNYCNWQGDLLQPPVTSYTWTIAAPDIISPSVYDKSDYSNSSLLEFTWSLDGDYQVDTQDVKIQISSDLSFAADKIVHGGANGISLGRVTSYTFIVKDQDIQQYYARVSVNPTLGVAESDPSWKDWGTKSDGIKIIGGVKGTIKSVASSGTIGAALAGATINLKRSGSVIATTTSDATTGNFLFSNVLIGTMTSGSYSLEISMSGYSPSTKSNIVVSIGQDTDVGQIYLMQTGGTKSVISGSVIDANTGYVVKTATIKVYNGSNVLKETVTSTNADPSNFTTSTTTKLDPGIYTMIISQPGYYDLQKDNIIVNGGNAAAGVQGRQAMCKFLTEPQVRVVVLWGQNPTDYDFHVVGPTTATPGDGLPANRFHVYWLSHKSYREDTGVFNNTGDPTGTTYTTSLVQDVNGSQWSGYGPESINLFRASGVQYAKGVYTYTLHDWTNQTGADWNYSAITMRVYDSQGLVREVNFPSVSVTNLSCWKAMKINIIGTGRSNRYINVANQFGNLDYSSKTEMDW